MTTLATNFCWLFQALLDWVCVCPLWGITPNQHENADMAQFSGLSAHGYSQLKNHPSNQRRCGDRAQRRSVLEKALEALGIAAPVAVRWYKKANGRMDAPIQREKIGHASIGLLFALPPIVMEVKHGVFPLVFYTP